MPAPSAGPAASSSSGPVDPKSPRVLVIDVGGTNVKILATGEKEPRKFPSGPKMTPKMMVAGVKKLAVGWQYDRVSIGYPGPIRQGRPVREPHNVARGWMRFDFSAAFGCPVRMINDAAMQALGGYNGGKMLFLGLGTGLGSAMIADGVILPMELAHLPFKKSIFEDYVGVRAFKKQGKRKWRGYVS
jgi:polyphosphate glucokinase